MKTAQKARAFAVVTAAALGATLLVAPTPATAADPGITATSVKIGSHQPLTGPAAPGYSKIAPASKAYFAYINAKGGINGRKINYIYRDDAYNPSTTSAVVRKLVTQDKVFAIFNGLGTPTHSAVVRYLNQARVPDLFVASGCKCWNNKATNPMTFGWQTSYSIEGKVLGLYIKENFPGKKVGVFYQDDDFGKDGLKGVEQTLGTSAIVARRSYVSSNTNVSPQIAALKAAGAEVVVSFSIPAFTALALTNAARQSYDPQFVVSNVGSDPTTLKALLKRFGGGENLLEGMLTDSYLPSTDDTSNSFVKLYRQINAQYNNNAEFDGNVMYGMAAAASFVDALRLAGRNPTRASIVAAVESGRLPQGAGVVPFRFSSSVHAGYSGVRMARLSGGKGVAFGPRYRTGDGTSAVTRS